MFRFSQGQAQARLWSSMLQRGKRCYLTIVSCKKRKRSETDGQGSIGFASRACRVEEHEEQQAAVIVAWPPPLRPVGRPRKLPAVEAGARADASGPSNGGRGGGMGRDMGRGAEPIVGRCPRESRPKTAASRGHVGTKDR